MSEAVSHPSHPPNTSHTHPPTLPAPAPAALLPLLAQTATLTLKRSATQTLPSHTHRPANSQFPLPPRRKHTARSRHITAEAARHGAAPTTPTPVAVAPASMFLTQPRPATLDNVTSATSVAALSTRTSLRPTDYAPTDAELLAGVGYRTEGALPVPTQLPLPIAAVPDPFTIPAHTPVPAFATAALMAQGATLLRDGPAPSRPSSATAAAVPTTPAVTRVAPAATTLSVPSSLSAPTATLTASFGALSTPAPAPPAATAPLSPARVSISPAPASPQPRGDATLWAALAAPANDAPANDAGAGDLAAARGLVAQSMQTVRAGLELTRARLVETFAEPAPEPPVRPQSLSQAVSALQRRERGLGEDSVLFKTRADLQGTTAVPLGTHVFNASQTLPGPASPFSGTTTSFASTASAPIAPSATLTATTASAAAAPVAMPALLAPATTAVPLTALAPPKLGVLADKVARRTRDEAQAQFQREKQRLETEIASLRRFLGTNVSVKGEPLAQHSLQLMAAQLAELREVAATVIVRLEQTEMEKLQLQQRLLCMDDEADEARERHEQLLAVSTEQHAQLEQLQSRYTSAERERTRLLAVVRDAVSVAQGQERKQAAEARTLQETQQEYEEALTAAMDELHRTKLALRSQEHTGAKLKEYVHDMGKALSESQAHAKELVHTQAELSSLKLQVREREREEGEGQKLQAGLLKAAEELGRRVAEAEREKELVAMERKREKRIADDLKKEVVQVRAWLMCFCFYLCF